MIGEKRNRGQTTFFVAAVTRQRQATKNVVCPRFYSEFWWMTC